MESVLDVGCGSNSPLAKIKKNFYLVGVDVFEPSIKKSKKEKKLPKAARVGRSRLKLRVVIKIYPLESVHMIEVKATRHLDPIVEPLKIGSDLFIVEHLILL